MPSAPDAVAIRTQADRAAFQFRIPETNNDGTRPADIRRVEVYGYTGTPPDEASIIEDGALVAEVPVREPVEQEEGEGERKEAPPRPPGSMETGFDQGATVVVFETLGPGQRSVVVPKKEPRARAEETLELSGALRPPTPEAPSRIYVAVGVSRRGRRGALSARGIAPLEPSASAPGKPEVKYDDKQVTVTWVGPPDFRRPTLASPAGTGLLEAKPLGIVTSGDGYNVYLDSGGPASAPAATASGARVGGAKLPAPLNASPLDSARFEEPVGAFGPERCYTVTTVSRFGDGTVESAPSPPACVMLTDTFPPAAPAGLAAVGSQGAVNLIWSPNQEADIEGYMVLRAQDAGEMTPLTAEPVKVATYRDESVKPGVRYTYVVIAVDTAGNRSQPSNKAEESAR